MKEGILIRKKIYKGVVAFLVLFLILLIIQNPNRADFNNAVFEGKSNPITENQEIMKNIRDINLKDYLNDSHPLIKRRYYLLFSIYDIQNSGTNVYSILGILKKFKLLN